MFVAERIVKKYVRQFLNRIGAYVYMPVPMGMGATTLDYLNCVPIIVTPNMVGKRIGLFVAIETKAKGKKITTRQKLIGDQIRAAGGIVIYAWDVVDVKDAMIAEGLWSPTMDGNNDLFNRDIK